jgi:hypothetical protein
MSGDYSKYTFDPIKDFSAVMMQQGRVQLDSDWNEFVEILLRRVRAETIDTIGRTVVPKETIDGFKIALDGTTLTIGAGRMYVDGLLAENHGDLPYEFDPVLEELSSQAPIDFDQQPYLPHFSEITPPPTTGGPHLVYLDVWRREVGHLIDPDLVEKAVGVDTTTRQQTVWQVKVLPDVGSGATCDSDDLDDWDELIEPSAGRLTTDVLPPGDEGPCLLPPESGYKGLENQLYRVEVHDGGEIGEATFKFSRDNASVATSVIAMPALDKLVVDSTGKDDYLRFNPGDWVEIKDDWLELAGEPGLMGRVKTVDDDTRTITLHDDLTAGVFPTGADDKLDPERHTRLIRWDQQGKIFEDDETEFFDLDAAASEGVIPVPASGTTLVLEKGVTVAFDLATAGGEFHIGDYWVFAARTVDGSVEQLVEAPPLGIHHHYARLAMVTFPSNIQDCRDFWPPEFGGGGCECTVCVSADAHNSGDVTIQWAIDQVKEEGGTVCLGPGVYLLGDESLTIDGAQSVRIRGKGWRTILTHSGDGPAITMQNSLGVWIERLALLTSGETGLYADLATVNCIDVSVEESYFLQTGSKTGYRPAIGFAGVIADARFCDNVIFASSGIGNLAGAQFGHTTAALVDYTGFLPLLSAQLRIEDNLMLCQMRGISLDGFSLHMAETRVAGNTIVGCTQASILSRGWVFPGSGVEIQSNKLGCLGWGVVLGADGGRINDNDISAFGERSGKNGIALMPGIDPQRSNQAMVLGNRIYNMAGYGIYIGSKLRSAMIKDNFIETVGQGGIIMGEQASADMLSIENNHLLDVADEANDREQAVSGIRLLRTEQVDIAGNVIRGVGKTAIQSLSRSGIQVLAVGSGRIAGNEITEIGPLEGFIHYSAGIEVAGSYENLDIADNVVRRYTDVPEEVDGSKWIGLLIWQEHREKVRYMYRTMAEEGGVEEMETTPAAGAQPEEMKASYIRMDKDVEYVYYNDNNYVLVDGYLVQLPRGREVVAVRGNVFETVGSGYAVYASAMGSFMFNENRCSQRSQVGEEGGSGPAVVRIGGGAIIAGSNYLEGSVESPGMRLNLPTSGAYTILGNICSGGIIVNGAALVDPWRPLNVIGV